MKELNMNLLKIKLAFLFIFFSLSGSNQDDGYQENIENEITEQVDNNDKKNLNENSLDKLKLLKNQKDSMAKANDMMNIAIIGLLVFRGFNFYKRVQNFRACQTNSKKIQKTLDESSRFNMNSSLDELQNQYNQLSDLLKNYKSQDRHLFFERNFNELLLEIDLIEDMNKIIYEKSIRNNAN